MENKDFFSSNLSWLRKQCKLTQKQLAKKIGVDQTAIGRWEDGNREPSMGNVISLAKVFNIPIDILTDKDLTIKDNNAELDEYDLLFSKFKDLEQNDKELIKNIIETRKKQIDEQLGESE